MASESHDSSPGATPRPDASTHETPYDAVAETYHAVRPGYPDDLFRSIDEYASMGSSPRVLEVGVGTGQATRQMVDMGWRVDAIEPGGELIAAAQVHEYGGSVRFHNARFEDVRVETETFDLVAAATSWHWIEPGVSYLKAHDALRPGGTIALFWNAHVPDTSRPDWAPIRRAYLDVVPELADLAPLTPDRPDYDPVGELEQSGWFGSVERRDFPFEVSYTADRFLELLDTYASHNALDDQHRTQLHHRLRTAIGDELGGQVVKPYNAVLVLGRRASSSLSSASY